MTLRDHELKGAGWAPFSKGYSYVSKLGHQAEVKNGR